MFSEPMQTCLLDPALLFLLSESMKVYLWGRESWDQSRSNNVQTSSSSSSSPCFTFHSIRMELSHDQLPDGPLQVGVVLTRLIPRRPPALASRSQVDSVVRTPVDVRRLQRIYDVQAGGGRQAAGRSSAGDGFEGIDPFPETFYLCACRWSTGLHWLVYSFIYDSYPGENSKVAKHLIQAPQALIGPNITASVEFYQF